VKEKLAENWRPRKMWRDSLFISEVNTESVVFPEDIEGMTDLIEIQGID
jgi:hypothetical protein